ncbi:MAG: hypothetical protein FWB81_07405, partial [Cystobacterineae bacterium]|nr:hypothetical protein [Cystobacterineae bacterium]
MSNTDEKEKDEKEKSSPRPDKGLSNPPAKSPPKEHTLRATPLTEELPSTEASPYLSAISPKTKQPASRPVKTYPLPQRTTVLFGKSELSALEKEFQSAAPPKPPNITSNVPADVQNTPSPSTPLPTPTPAALKAQTSYTETLPPSQPLTPTKPSIGPGVLVTPSESLLSPEDYDDADPSETLSALLDEVFSEGVPDFEAMFLPPSALPPSSTKPPPPPLDLPSAPP